MTKKSLKIIGNPELHGDVSTNPSDLQLNVEQKALTHFAQNPREMCLNNCLFSSFCHFQGPKRVNSSLVLIGHSYLQVVLLYYDSRL